MHAIYGYSNGDKYLKNDVLQCACCEVLALQMITIQYCSYFKISNLRVHMGIQDNVGWF